MQWLECTSTTAGTPISSSSWELSIRGNLEVTDIATPVSGG
jgi:hypothetical protein